MKVVNSVLIILIFLSCQRESVLVYKNIPVSDNQARICDSILKPVFIGFQSIEKSVLNDDYFFNTPIYKGLIDTTKLLIDSAIILLEPYCDTLERSNKNHSIISGFEKMKFYSKKNDLDAYYSEIYDYLSYVSIVMEFKPEGNKPLLLKIQNLSNRVLKYSGKLRAIIDRYGYGCKMKSNFKGKAKNYKHSQCQETVFIICKFKYLEYTGGNIKEDIAVINTETFKVRRCHFD